MVLRPRKVKLALRLALFLKRREGFTGVGEQAVTQILDNDDGLEMLTEHIAAETCGYGGRVFGNTITDVLQWILDHWEEILEMIMAIISLFPTV